MIRFLVFFHRQVRNLIRTLKDQYLCLTHRHLRTAFKVSSHLTLQERIVLNQISDGAGYIVEIGSYVGASACCFGASAREPYVSKIICIDTWNNDAMTEGNRDTWSEFKENTFQFNDRIVPVRGRSTEVVEKVRQITPSIDVLFIDGDHSYNGVKSDWEAYKTFLKPGSIVIFHDYGWAEGVRRVIEEDVLPLVISTKNLPNMWWGTIGARGA